MQRGELAAVGVTPLRVRTTSIAGPLRLGSALTRRPREARNEQACGEQRPGSHRGVESPWGPMAGIVAVPTTTRWVGRLVDRRILWRPVADHDGLPDLFV